MFWWDRAALPQKFFLIQVSVIRTTHRYFTTVWSLKIILKSYPIAVKALYIYQTPHIQCIVGEQEELNAESWWKEEIVSDINCA